MSSQPNVLFILSDQHNAKVLGHAGHPQVQTPHLDRMAREGTRFTNAVTANPICTPSRTSFHSGQYCHNHGYYGLSGPNPGGLPSLYGHFRHHGYLSAAIGKIHCPDSWLEDDCDVFHETTGCSVGGTSQAYKDALGERHALEDHGRMPEFGPQGQQSMEGRPSPLSFDESQEGWIAAEAIRTIDAAADAGKPFCIHASLPRPHQCTAPSQEFWDLYQGMDLELPPNADLDLEAAGKAPHLIRTAERWRKGEWALIEPKTFEAARQRKLRGYLAAISQVDAAVGRMLSALEERGIADNTIVVYSSDHGDYATEFGIMEKAPGICHDAISRIPFLMWGAGIPAGAVRDALIQSVDLANTLCARAGLPLLETADGPDASPLIDHNQSIRKVAVTEFALSKSIRKGDWRLVYYPRAKFAAEHPNGFGELYNLIYDPYEQSNRWHDAD
ncbi:MAG: sulfatase-like hydrolase/transferase [Planctomycetota bacterium]|jgi:arylsulfatase|nr:sulfatase-like hydrolase/transferase [Planctomycetota bacterium]